MSNEQLDITTLIAVVVLIVLGAILYWIGKKNKPKGILLYIGLGLMIGALAITIANSSELRDSLVAVAIIATTFFAAVSIEANKRLRKESVDKEDQDRKERLLHEIRDWALKTAENAISRQTRVPHELWETRLKYKYSISASVYIREIAIHSFNNLCPLIDDVIEKLNQSIETTIKVIQRDMQGDDLIKSENNLRESVEVLLKALASGNY